MKKGKNYKYSEIEKYANENNYNIIEHGEFLIGKNIIVLDAEDKDITITFVLTGFTTEGIFECVYSD